MADLFSDERKAYTSESGAVYTCDIHSVSGRKEFRWKRDGVALEDAACVSLEKCQPLAKQYRAGEIDEFEFVELAKKKAVPVSGERVVIVYILNRKLSLSTLIKGRP